jgi:hypothetical protein
MPASASRLPRAPIAAKDMGTPATTKSGGSAAFRDEPAAESYDGRKPHKKPRAGL